MDTITVTTFAVSEVNIVSGAPEVVSSIRAITRQENLPNQRGALGKRRIETFKRFPCRSADTVEHGNVRYIEGHLKERCEICRRMADVRIAYKQRHKYMDYRKNKGRLVFRFCLEHVVQGVNRNKG